MKILSFLKDTIRTSSPFLRLFFALFIWLVVSALLLFFSEQISVLFFKTSLFRIDLAAIESNPQELFIFKIATLVQSIAVFVIPPFVIAWIINGRTVDYLYIKRPTNYLNFIWAALLIFACIPLINFLDEINKMIHFPAWMGGMESGMNETEAAIEKIYGLFSKAPSISVFLLNVLIMAIVPAIGEELMFRGVLQRMLVGILRNRHIGVILCAFIFGAIHSQAHSIMPRFLLGLILGYVMLWTGSIWMSMLMHFINNLMNIGYSVMQERGMIGNGLEQIGKIHDQLWITAVSVLLMGGLLWLIYKKKNTSPESAYNAS